MIKNVLINDNCLNAMMKLEPNSVDLILTDLPFGQTCNAWDKIIPFTSMWTAVNHVRKDNTAVCLMGMQPFTTLLNASNIEEYRYEYIWKMKEKRNFLNANRMPLREHLNISVFYKRLPIYHPQKTTGHKPVHKYKKHSSDGSNYGKTSIGVKGGGQTDRFPTSIIDIPYKPIKNKIHPTQKPAELYEWLIKTYTDIGMTVLDFTAGLCTCAEACINTERKFICIEKDKTIFEKGYNRIFRENHQIKMF